MGSFMKTVQTNEIVRAVLFIVLGLVLMLIPGITLVTIVFLVGGVFAVSGAVSLFAYGHKGSPSYQMGGALTTGICLLAIALVMFVFPTAVAGFFSILLGAVIILCGVANAVRSLGLMRAFGGGSWVACAIVSVLVVIGGVVIIWNPFETTAVFVMVLGALLLVNGVSNLVVELGVRRHADR